MEYWTRSRFFTAFICCCLHQFGDFCVCYCAIAVAHIAIAIVIFTAIAIAVAIAIAIAYRLVAIAYS